MIKLNRQLTMYRRLLLLLNANAGNEIKIFDTGAEGDAGGA